VAVAAQLQKESALKVAIFADEGLIAIQILELNPSGYGIALGRVQDVTGRDLSVATRRKTNRKARKAKSIRSDETGLPACRTE
jgi:predicted butyrate kinase (DUF1464 family)